MGEERKDNSGVGEARCPIRPRLRAKVAKAVRRACRPPNNVCDGRFRCSSWHRQGYHAPPVGAASSLSCHSSYLTPLAARFPQGPDERLSLPGIGEQIPPVVTSVQDVVNRPLELDA